MGGYTVMNDRVWTVRRHLRRRLGGSQRGATAVEYGLPLALIVVVAFGAMAGFGQENQEVYRAAADAGELQHDLVTNKQ